MQSNSPKFHKINKLQSSNKNSSNSNTKKKTVSDFSCVVCQNIHYPSCPDTPKNFKLFPTAQEESPYLKTAALTNTLIKAVENQKQILKNIKSISAQILRNKKQEKKFIKQSMNPKVEERQFYFPIKNPSNSTKQLPKTLYGIEEDNSNEQSQEVNNFDEYCLSGATKPKAYIEPFETQPYLKPTVFTNEKIKIKTKKYKRGVSKKHYDSLKVSREKSRQFGKSVSHKKSKEKDYQLSSRIEKTHKKARINK